jgi:hypothetical protein
MCVQRNYSLGFGSRHEAVRDIAVADWTSGYVTEIGYTHGYYSELNPLSMRQALLSKAVQHRWGEPLRYLELGFGQGLSLNIHAAATNGEYWGCDFNPTQAANALELAAASGANVKILDASFEELAGRRDLPTFDIIALHGIWTWVSDANRRLIVEIARRHLAVGGVFYVSYNTTPGWSPAMPLRHLLTLHAEYASGAAQGLTAKLEAGLDFAQSLAIANAAYFRVNPAVVERLKRIKSMPANYSVHEYLTADWHPMAFSDMAQHLSEAKLSFAATTHLLDHVDAIYLTPDQQKLMQGLSHPVLRESVRDYLVNQQFRRDLWVKGLRPMAPFDHNAMALSQSYTLATAAEAVPFKTQGSAGEVQLQEAVYKPVVEALANSAYAAKTLKQLCTELPQLKPTQVAEAVNILIGMGHALPAQSPEMARSTKAACDRLNAYIIRQAAHSGDAQHLASPVVGGGIAVNRFQQLFLTALKNGKTTPTEWAQDAWAVLDAQGQRLTKEGKILDTANEHLAELTQQATAFEAQRLPILRALQVL